MDNELIALDPEMLSDNVFRIINEDWMLITAGRPEKFNTMTASWGGMGILWGRKVCFCFIRPTRYTYEIIENSDVFTLCFFDDSYKSALEYCGSHSGRDVDKVAETGLTPVFGNDSGIYFKEARIVLKCRKLYYHDFDPGSFLDSRIEDIYPLKDYHRMYIGEIISCMKR